MSWIRSAGAPDRSDRKPPSDHGLLRELWLISHFGWIAETTIRRALIISDAHEILADSLTERLRQLLNRAWVEQRHNHLGTGDLEWLDCDVALTVLANIVYRRFVHGLHAAYHSQTPDTIREYLINGIGERRFSPRHLEVRLRRRAYTPALRAAGYQDRHTEIPWWGGRTVTYACPAR